MPLFGAVVLRVTAAGPAAPAVTAAPGGQQDQQDHQGQQGGQDDLEYRACQKLLHLVDEVKHIGTLMFSEATRSMVP